MRITRHVCLLAAVLVLAAAKSAAAPIGGVWEGRLDGHKAITLEIREDDKLHGSATFYIRERKYAPAPPVEIESPQWDGSALSFAISDGGPSVRFVMKLTGAGSAELRQLASDAGPERVIAMAAIR